MTERADAIRVVLCCLLAVFILAAGQGYQNAPISAEELALGKGTVSVEGVIEGRVIHCHDVDDLEPCIANARSAASAGQRLIVWLGNSQLHAINQYTAGEQTAPTLLHQQRLSAGDYVIAISQPNANLQEHFLLFTYLLARLPVAHLILPVVFDDMREDGVRERLLPAINHKRVHESLQRTEVGRLILEHKKSESLDDDVAGLKGTPQQITEQWFERQLQKTFDLWSYRPEMRVLVFSSIYKFRNWLFGITPSSKRRVIPGIYKKNEKALDAILALADSNNVSVTTYIPPLRNDVAIPYDVLQYDQFKAKIAVLADERGSDYRDLGDLVPGQLWGAKGSTTFGEKQELDFMHFQAGGHELLSRELHRALGGKFADDF
jgi:hypothetical protein